MNIIFFRWCRRCHPCVYFSGARVSLLFCQEGNVTPVTSTHMYRKYHFPMCFLINTIFPDITKKITFEENIIFPGIFWERSSFLLCLKNKIIFLGKRNIVFPDNTRKIIFQWDIFGKTIFSKHLEKENMVFCAVWYKPFLFTQKHKRTFSYCQLGTK